jgi:DNA modification methylase
VSDDVCTCDHERPDGRHVPSPGCQMCEWCRGFEPFYTDPLVTLHVGDCLEVLPTLEADSVDAVVTDPPYGLEFMGRSWDRLGDVGTTSHSGPTLVAGGERGQYGKVSYSGSANKKCRRCNKWAWDHEGRKCECEVPDFPNVGAHQGRLMQDWHHRWAVEALRVTKPGGYLLAFGGTRTHHRLVCALEDAGWIIRDELDWIYASGFPKGKANLKPAHEPIVLARKPGPLRPLGIDATRIPAEPYSYPNGPKGNVDPTSIALPRIETPVESHPLGRWPSNVLLSDPELFDQPNPYVVGSGATTTSGDKAFSRKGSERHWEGGAFGDDPTPYLGDSGGYSRFFIIPKADRAERERGLADRERVVAPNGNKWTDQDYRTPGVLRSRANVHPTVKPIDLMRHLVRLVTPPGGVVLDPFLGSGTTCLAASEEGFRRRAGSGERADPDGRKHEQ